MSVKQAAQSLIKALPRAQGRLKTGIITTLGERRDACALPVLIPLLASKDIEHACAVAAALGNIGSGLVFPSLQEYSTKGSPALQSAATEGTSLLLLLPATTSRVVVALVVPNADQRRRRCRRHRSRRLLVRIITPVVVVVTTTTTITMTTTDTADGTDKESTVRTRMDYPWDIQCWM